MTDTDRTIRAKRALELAEKASKGPWEWEQRGENGSVFSLMSPNKIPGAEPPFDEGHPYNLLNTYGAEWDRTGAANRAFIAEARTLLPQLAQDVLDLEAECERLKRNLNDSREATEHWSRQYSVVLAELVARADQVDWLSAVIAAGREMYERACAERDAEREACERWVQRAANRGRLLERLELRLRDLEDRTAKVK